MQVIDTTRTTPTRTETLANAALSCVVAAHTQCVTSARAFPSPGSHTKPLSRWLEWCSDATAASLAQSQPQPPPPPRHHARHRHVFTDRCLRCLCRLQFHGLARALTGVDLTQLHLRQRQHGSSSAAAAATTVPAMQRNAPTAHSQLSIDVLGDDAKKRTPAVTAAPQSAAQQFRAREVCPHPTHSMGAADRAGCGCACGTTALLGVVLSGDATSSSLLLSRRGGCARGRYAFGAESAHATTHKFRHL